MHESEDGIVRFMHGSQAFLLTAGNKCPVNNVQINADSQEVL